MTDVKPAAPFIVVREDGAGIEQLKGQVFAIGNFDGVHRGHRAVIAAARARARTFGVSAAALTFEPHPVSVLRPEKPVFRLTDEPTKLRLLAATELDGAVVLTFDRSLAGLTAEAFISDILVKRLGARGAAVGYDFHFGKDRRGSPRFLATHGPAAGLAIDVVPPVEDEGRPISSGAVREALAVGRVVEATELLGYPWFVTGTVVHGEKRGRDLGFPTANVVLDPACGLKHGIYAVRVGHGGRRHEGVASFGRRPMFDNGPPLLEVHLFGFSGDLYGESLDIAFIGWIRSEVRFATNDDLVRRMHEDARIARADLARAAGIFPPLRHPPHHHA